MPSLSTNSAATPAATVATERTVSGCQRCRGSRTSGPRPASRASAASDRIAVPISTPRVPVKGLSPWKVEALSANCPTLMLPPTSTPLSRATYAASAAAPMTTAAMTARRACGSRRASATRATAPAPSTPMTPALILPPVQATARSASTARAAGPISDRTKASSAMTRARHHISENCWDGESTFSRTPNCAPTNPESTTSSPARAGTHGTDESRRAQATARALAATRATSGRVWDSTWKGGAELTASTEPDQAYDSQ